MARIDQFRWREAAKRSRRPRRLAIAGLAATAAAAMAATGTSTSAAQAAVPAAGLGASLSTALPAVTLPPAPVATVRVIVRYSSGNLAAAKNAVVAAGGRVGATLGLISAFTAQVPATAVTGLRTVAGVLSVTVNAPLALPTERWKADKDSNSLYSIAATTGANSAWTKLKLTGTGIGVALIDSGVTPVAGLTGAGKVVNGPDLSFESQTANLKYVDTFGHGTHMAGIIAGRDSTVAAGKEDTKSGFVGVAPDARIISVKVASADGATDVSQVIAGIDWAVTHRNDAGLNIRVINLSYGTDSVQAADLDPLSYAVEAAWRSGIVVVVAVGNEGTAATMVTMPAANPYVLAVGASDSHQTDSVTDDTVATFSTRGSDARHADLVAPGRSVVALRDPGSYIDSNFPEGLVTGDTAQRYFRGSGSSQATAVVSGAVALLLQQRPTLKPDQVKALLTGSAVPMAAEGTDRIGQGAGQLNVAKALAAATPTAVQTWPAATGLGSLEASRGGSHVVDPLTGIALTGESDVLGGAWSPATWTARSGSGTAWTAGNWNGSTWTGTGWTGASWTTKTWSGTQWSGRTWSGDTWSGRTWSDAVWTGRTWSGRTWSGTTWSGRTWSGRTWSGAGWS